MWDKITTCWYNLKYGIPNFWIWRKIVWQDRDWDHWFLYSVMEFKLRNMIKLQRKYGHSVNSEDYAKQMELAAFALKRLMEDEYHENAFIHHDRKWGKLDMWGTPTKNPELTELNFNRRKVCNRDAYDQEAKESKRLQEHVRNMRNQDLDLVYTTMRKYSEGWWD